MPVWQETHPGVEEMRVAVMGCVVNGPGECKHADIGITLPGTFEDPVAPVFIDGRLTGRFARRARSRIHRHPRRLRGPAVSDADRGLTRTPRVRRHTADVITRLRHRDPDHGSGRVRLRTDAGGHGAAVRAGILAGQRRAVDVADLGLLRRRRRSRTPSGAPRLR